MIEEPTGNFSSHHFLGLLSNLARKNLSKELPHRQSPLQVGSEVEPSSVERTVWRADLQFERLRQASDRNLACARDRALHTHIHGCASRRSLQRLVAQAGRRRKPRAKFTTKRRRATIEVFEILDAKSPDKKQ
jgi:hypothetical protein